MRRSARPTAAPWRRRGSVLVESLLAILVFSLGLVALLLLLSAALRESGNAHLRSQASLLAADLIERMWNGDRSLAGLRSRFVATENGEADEYAQWLSSVQRSLPGVSAARHRPQLTIDEDRSVTLLLQWQSPGEADAHQLVVHSRISD